MKREEGREECCCNRASGKCMAAALGSCNASTTDALSKTNECSSLSVPWLPHALESSYICHLHLHFCCTSTADAVTIAAAAATATAMLRAFW